MSTLPTLSLIWFLFTKHFVVDFLLQPQWMYANKGDPTHPGGYVHAGLHGAVTLLILAFGFAPLSLAITLGAAETVAHWAIDLAKVRINAAKGWGPTTSEYFWYLLGYDQWLHNGCYVLIVAVVAR